MSKRSRGRPTKLDDIAAEKIIAAVRAGAYRKVAAVFAGVTERTLREWMAAGKADPKSKHGIFRRKLLEASATAEIQVGTVAYRAASSDPDYALRYMSVRWRKRWNSRIEVVGKDGAELVPQTDPSSLYEKLKKIESLGGKP
jgi:hypothetical protein